MSDVFEWFLAVVVLLSCGYGTYLLLLAVLPDREDDDDDH